MTTLISPSHTKTHRSSPNKRYSHANTSPYRRFSHTSSAFDSPAASTSDKFDSNPSSRNGSPYVSQSEQAFTTRGGATLADELANALYDDSGVGDGDYDSDANHNLVSARTSPAVRFQSPAWTRSPAKVDITRIRDSGVELASSTESTPNKELTERSQVYESPGARRFSWDKGKTKQAQPRTSRRSEHLTSSPFDIQKQNTSAIKRKPNLDAYIAEIASLASPSPHTTEDTIASFCKTLSSLPSEITLEQSGRNYARAASSTAINTNTSLHALTTLVSSILLKPNTIATADLEILIEQLSTVALPRPTLYITASTIHARRTTDNLLELLSTLSDSIHMIRETESTATRRLQSTRELATSLRKEFDEVEKTDKLLRDGEWESRLAGRKGGKMCREMVKGFESVCDGMRAKLVEAAAKEGLAASPKANVAIVRA